MATIDSTRKKSRWAAEPDSHLNVQLVLRPTIPHPDLSYLFQNDPSRTSGVRLELGRDEGRHVDFLKVDGNVNREHAGKLEGTMWKHLPDLRPLRADEFGDYNHGVEVRHSDQLALTQLLIHISSAASLQQEHHRLVCTYRCRPEPAAIHARQCTGGSGYGKVRATIASLLST